ncbi:terminase small subunit [Shivajiella indica]|uniref:Terminase small subunit n=1 Tax=Shivajiella indica TaxID=872115 RepID=A0ABW5B3Y3_9BACT
MKHQIQADKDQIELTEKEYRFANYYLGEARFNATEAAKLAGYSENTARQQGSRMLTKVNIEKYIQSKSSEILQRNGVTQEKVLAEIVKIAFSDITEFFNDDWSLKKVSQVKPGKAATIKTLKKTDSGVSIQIHDKVKSLLLLWDLVKDESKLK